MHIYKVVAVFLLILSSEVYADSNNSVESRPGTWCVKESSKVGDILPSGGPNPYVILAINGPSVLCLKNPSHPIKVELGYKFIFKSESAIKLPADFQEKPTSIEQRHRGVLVNGVSISNKSRGFFLYAVDKSTYSDIQKVFDLESNLKRNLLDNFILKNIRKFELNGLSAMSFESHGKIKGLFRGEDVVFHTVILEGQNEILWINLNSSIVDYEIGKDEIKRISESIYGLKNNEIPDTADSQIKSSVLPIRNTDIVVTDAKSPEPQKKLSLESQNSDALVNLCKSLSNAEAKIECMENLIKQSNISKPEMNAVKPIQQQRRAEPSGRPTDKWLQKSESELIKAFGVPVRSYESGAVKYLTYVFDEGTMANRAAAIRMTCEYTFNLENGIVFKVEQKGYGCPW